MHNEQTDIIIQDGWTSLQSYTAARIALGRTGVSVPAKEMLQFKMAHAHARDAVFSVLNKDDLITQLHQLQSPFILLESKAANRHIYLQRPDLGRRLDNASVKALEPFKQEEYDVCINIADGLSAEAINNHAIPVLTILIKMCNESKLRVAPVCIIEQARVAISDETGSLIGAKLSLILIGERPGLSSPDSMGAYLTYAPKVGLTDERRNCVSNIRPEGLPYQLAADKIFYLIRESLRLQLSGIELKDNSSQALERE